MSKVQTNRVIDHKVVNIFLPISFNICIRCSKEPSHGDGSFEYQQHMFSLRNKKNFKYSLLFKGMNALKLKFMRPGSTLFVKVLFHRFLVYSAQV